MPLVAMLFSFLIGFIPAIVAKVLLAAGIGVISYTGFNLLVSSLTSAVMDRWSGMSGDIAAIAGLAQADVCVSMWLSALAIRLTITTVNGVLNKVTFTNKSLG
jgi:hypothetical protein